MRKRWLAIALAAFGVAGCAQLGLNVSVGAGGIGVGVNASASIWDFITGGGEDDDEARPEFASLGACLDALADTDLSWRRVNDIDGRGECGVKGAVRVTGGHGVNYSQPMTLTCEMAYRMAEYHDDVVQPLADDHFDMPVTGMETISGYSCRNIRGTNRLSQHGLGKAIDIRGFTLANGRRIALPAAWNAGGSAERFMNDLHEEACDRFSVVLGPDADAAHRDHFHFDVGPHKYCK